MFATVPLIVVYTKFDPFVDQLTMRLTSSHGKLDDESLTKLACSNAESKVGEWHNEITRLTGESVPYTFVSSKLVVTWFGFVPHAEINLDSQRKLQVHAPKFSRPYSPSSWDAKHARGTHHINGYAHGTEN